MKEFVASPSRYLALAAGAVLLLTMGASLATEEPDAPIKTVVVDPHDDRGKVSEVHGLLGWRIFEIAAGTSGESEDQLRFKFTAPAEILQVDVSVDIGDPRANLVEFLVGINSTRAYGLDRSADWLMQASWTRTSSTGDLDETTRLPPGVHVAAGDFVGVSAWLGGEGSGAPIRLSPEIALPVAALVVRYVVGWSRGKPLQDDVFGPVSQDHLAPRDLVPA